MAVERTLANHRGFPYPGILPSARAVRRALLTALAVGALVAGVASTAAALGGYADAGIGAGDPGSILRDVSPTGFAWREGIRPGQTIVRLQDPAAPGGWLVETAEDGRHHIARAEPYDAALRAALPSSLGATLAGSLAVVFLRGHRAWVAAVSCLGLLLAASALALHGKPEASTAALAAGALAPGAWIAWQPRMRRPLSLAATAVMAAFILVWSVARLRGVPIYDGLEVIRSSIAFWGTAVVVLGSVVIPLLRSRPGSVARPRISDIVAVGAVGGVAFAGVSVFALPPVLVGVVLFGALLVLPGWRRLLGPLTERLLLADIREHAAIEAAEEERAHLARELHDAPLQELAGVIRRLELIPDARGENEQLRAVAEQLRSVATELRPPVLDDLGLVAAIEFIAEKEATDQIAIETEIDDEAGLDRATRPPSDVELAIFRIVQEAIANAIRHADAATIRVSGTVRHNHVALEVADDGRGLVDDEARAAARRGHLGLASIRRRAQAIDADVSIEGSDRGTRVSVRWDR